MNSNTKSISTTSDISTRQKSNSKSRRMFCYSLNDYYYRNSLPLTIAGADAFPVVLVLAIRAPSSLQSPPLNPL
ncbi:MAG TPA: hypothetical protein VE544_12480 [Nitrososphaeraceae archaeon]|nr:hypothetical protein [Nitrososphaeraceae archaeon]